MPRLPVSNKGDPIPKLLKADKHMMIQSKADPGMRTPISVTCFLKTTANLLYQILLILDFSRYILDDDDDWRCIVQ